MISASFFDKMMKKTLKAVRKGKEKFKTRTRNSARHRAGVK